MRVKVANVGLGAAAVIGIVACIFYCEPLIKRLSNGAELASRHGRIIDATSGEGLSDVIVVRKWLTGGWCEAEKAVLTDSNGRYEIPDVSANVTFQRTWVHDLLVRILPIPVRGSGGFHAVVFLYKAGYVPDLRPENALPSDPHDEVPPVRMRKEPQDSDALRSYDRALRSNLPCRMHMPSAQPVQRHLHIVGQPITDADKDPEPILLCDGQPVSSSFDCIYKDHPPLVQRAAKELEQTALNDPAHETNASPH